MTTDADAEFAALVERQSRFVYKVVYAVLLNRHDAEDAVQETFLKLLRNRGWQKAENERAFLARVAWRVAIDLRPRSDRAASAIDAESETLPSSGPGPEQLAVGADEHTRIHAMIDALPEDLRVPLVLTSLEELSSREIGSILGIPDGTVRTRVQRARTLLREKLARHSTSASEVRHG